jgi:outer membrane scaffolding protein for murein synthesis (MipA/OmpV family)
MVSVQHQSGRLAGYYFGTPGYSPGATTNVVIEAFATLDVNEDWILVGSVRRYHHGTGITDSPLVSGRATMTWAFGIGRRF